MDDVDDGDGNQHSFLRVEVLSLSLNLRFDKEGHIKSEHPISATPKWEFPNGGVLPNGWFLPKKIPSINGC